MTRSLMLLALVCAIFAAGTAAGGEKCYFQGSVTWQNSCDYAVVELVNEISKTLYDTLYTSGDSYSFWDLTGLDPWRLRCWLVINESAGRPQTESGINWPEDFEGDYHYKNFSWP